MPKGFKPGTPKPPTSGRKKGVQNKFTVSAKAAFEQAFDMRGGAQALYEWSLEEPTEFYKLFAKLIPVKTEVTGPGGGPVQVETKIDFSAIPTPELTEYESVLARLRARAGPSVGSPAN